MIPFKSGMFVEDKDFCGRKKEIKELRTHISSSARVCIQGERRIGKSSLILETIRRTTKYKTLYVDFFSVRSEEDICKRLIAGILSFDKNDSFVMKMMKSFASLRPSLTVDPLTQQPSLEISTATKLPPRTIEKTFDVIQDLSNVVVVFDEFQDVADITSSKGVLAIFRSKIQSHNRIPYIFSGSIRSKMFEIFNSPDSPFFKSAICMDLGPIERNVFSDYIRDRFVIGKRNIGKDTINMIFDFAYDIPGDIQRLCYGIWEVTSYKAVIKEKHLFMALENIYAMNKRMYEVLLPTFSEQQFICLSTLAKFSGKANINKEFVERTGINIEVSVRKAMNRLVEKRMVMKTGATYKICDPFFGYWLKCN